MSTALKSQSGLSAFMYGREGIDAEQALSRAELHLEAMRVTMQNALEESVSAIGVHIAQSGEHMPRAAQRELYKLSDGILSVAATFDKATLGKVAYSLCDLLNAFDARNHWDAASARLHHDAMRMLQNTPDFPVSEQDELLSGLHKIVQSFSAPHAKTA